MTGKLTAILVCSTVLASFPGPGWSHFLPHKQGLSKKEKVGYFERSVRHERQALAWLANHRTLAGAGRETRFHRRALRWHSFLLAHWRAKLVPTDPVGAILYVFGVYGQQALAVANCESHLYPYAQNGQYLGMFQMGSYARATYGHGWDALTQARAAYAYFVASGRDWSPWSCGWAAH